MGLKKLNLIIGLLLFIISSCSTILVKQEQEDQKNKLSKAIIDSVKSRYTIIVYPFRNLTGEKDLDYLSNDLPDMLETHLKPIEYETSFIPFENADFTMNSNVLNLIEASNSIFTNYLIPVPSIVTQYSAITAAGSILTVVKTNTNMMITNIYNGTTQPFISTNMATNFITNGMATNVISTNLYKLTKENYMSLIMTEFTELTNQFCFIPIDVKKSGISLSTNIITNTLVSVATNLSNSITSNATGSISSNISSNIINNNYCEIHGSYSLVEKRQGPNQLKVDMTATFINKETNTITRELTGREDRLSDRIFDFVKPVRRICLNQETGDLIIDSQPEEASIYYDGTFIGKTPMYYPSIPGGKHIFAFLKDGFSQVVVNAIILTNRTNMIFKPIQQLETGGIVKIKSEPTNALVYIDSTYVGQTPLTLTNLTIETLHRVTIETSDSNYYPYYNNVTILNTNRQYEIDAYLSKVQGTPALERRWIWYGVYAGWGSVLYCVAWNVYSDYEQQYYDDQIIANPGNNAAQNSYNLYNNYYHASIDWGIGLGVLTLGLMCYALYNEEVYMGFNSMGPSDFSAYLCFKF
jgi:hypothetical protein